MANRRAGKEAVVAPNRFLASLKPAFAAAVLGIGLVFPSDAAAGNADAYWRFEEGAPNAAATGVASILDSSGSEDHGTPFGGPVYRVDVPVNPVPLTGAANQLSMEFDGLDDQISIPSTFLFHQPVDATLELWLKFPPLSHQSVFWTRPDSSDTNRFNFFVNDDSTFGFDYRSPSGTLHTLVGRCCTGIPIPRNTWTHVAIIRAANVYRLYIDGVLKATARDSSPDLPTATGWTISGRQGGEFRGLVDEVRLSKGALLPSQFLNAGGARCFGRAATIVGTLGPDALDGTPGHDVIVGLGGNDKLRGLGGNDSICGNAGTDELYAGEGADSLFGGAGDDLLHGTRGNDLLLGGDGSDAVYGDDGDDRLFGNFGDDLLHAGPGDDRLDGGPSIDKCNGGIGLDTAARCEILLFIESLTSTRIVDGQANVFVAGRSSIPPDTNGILPPVVAVGGADFVSFPNVSGAFSCCGGAFENGPDGAKWPFGQCCEVAAYRGISGLRDMTEDANSFYLVGVFLDSTFPTAPAPAPLDFTENHDFSDLSPGLQQPFFIGDGRDGAGNLQRFHPPPGATRLFLGFADFCGSGGPPDCYFDNAGGFTASLLVHLPEAP
jgi:Ca2+-binding RTX toxin-like protein